MYKSSEIQQEYPDIHQTYLHEIDTCIKIKIGKYQFAKLNNCVVNAK